MTMPSFKSVALALTLMGLSLVPLTGCKQDVVYQRSMSELNQKAQAMLASGDVNGAVARLEAAHDLQPDEPNTAFNLAIAYQTQGNYDKAIPLLNQLKENSGLDKAQVYKTLGITYEAKGDQLAAKVKEAEEQSKPDKTQIQVLESESLQNYQLAIESYQQALPGLKTEAEAVQKQVEALQARLEKPSQPQGEMGAGQP